MIWTYVGTFTRFGKGKGLYVFELNSESGALVGRQTVGLEDPSFVAVSRSRQTLYAATHSSHFEGRPGAGVVSFAIDLETGRLARRSDRLVGIPHAAYIHLDRTESIVLVACTLGGGVAVFPIAEDNRLLNASDVVKHEGKPIVALGHKVDAWPPEVPPGTPFPHSIVPDPSNRFVLVPDLGQNRVFVYALDVKQGKLTLSRPPLPTAPPAVGPRHLSFHPDGRSVFVLNERGSSVSWFDWDPDVGVLESVETVSCLPASFRGVSAAADIHVHPSGLFVYASNRGHDSIAIFQIDQSNRKLELIGLQPSGGQHPRNFAITPDARQVLVANMESDTIVAFAIDERNGQLQPTGSVTEVPSPSCIAFLVA